MTKLVSALAAVALLAAPVAASAQGHGGHMGGGGGHWGGGGGWSHGGWGGRGGFSRGGFNHFRGRDFFPFFGFGLGFALAEDPWFWGYPGWYGPYDPYWEGDYYGGPPPGPGPGYGPPPGAGANTAPPPAACGSWTWRADQGRYVWVAAPCQGPTGAPPPGS